LSQSHAYVRIRAVCAAHGAASAEANSQAAATAPSPRRRRVDRMRWVIGPRCATLNESGNCPSNPQIVPGRLLMRDTVMGLRAPVLTFSPRA